MRPQLLVVPECPNEGPALNLLHAALREVGLGEVPVDIVVVDSDHEAEARGFSGSPSFCVDQVDLFPGASSGLSCRVYRSADGSLQGLPDRQALVDRLHDIAPDG